MSMTMLDQRRIEAATLAEVYHAVAEEQGSGQALAVVERTLERMAFRAGQAFAETVPADMGGGQPNLAHFATILERWKGSGALDIEDVRLDGNELTFRVTRCAYATAMDKIKEAMGRMAAFVGSLT